MSEPVVAASTLGNDGSEVRYAIGCMTGTSLDGLDAALVRVTGHGLGMSASLVAHHAVDLDPQLADLLRSLAEGRPHPAWDFLRAGRAVGELYAQGVEELLAGQDGDLAVDLVAAHGQTLWHLGDEGLSWQLFDPWPIVRRLGIPVVYDLRQADLIAGGQGAPITPIADPILYGRGERLAVVNLGGVCNYTLSFPAAEGSAGLGEIRAEDLCPCNLLMDGMARVLLNKAYDKDGQATRAGRVLEPVVASIEAGLVQALEQRFEGPQSLGREQFGEAWIKGLLAGNPDVSAEDWLASSAASIARQLVAKIDPEGVERAILAGGGSLNPGLTAQIAQASQHPDIWRLSQDLGIPGEAREAAEFAILGLLSSDGVPVTLEAVTGAQNPGVAGSWAWPTPDLG
ncbi:anhydro-N-acetylmuramic acid kinase [Mucisphaera sp.]|uniref:anhydro-N-acetylmuramic acid kinase n=1 Tax=Mucisphaera sp. TaxID=2913024 RepID=UPI003D0C62B7